MPWLANGYRPTVEECKDASYVGAIQRDGWAFIKDPAHLAWERRASFTYYHGELAPVGCVVG